MKGFLEEVAADLYARYGEGLSERAVLFPSRRARLFFVDALGRIAGRPMWQPEWVTIDDLTGEISGLHTGDRVRLITELYKVYSAYHNEPFDKFYFWGDMLLTDFDTIDKYLIDAQMLFRNISEIKEIEADISYLTPAQLQHPVVLVLVRRAGRPFGGETPFSGDLEDPRPHLPPLPRSGSRRSASPTTAWCSAPPPTASAGAGSPSPSPGVMSWRGSTPFRSARSAFSGSSPRRPKPIFTGTTTLIIRTTPNRRRVCSCVRTWRSSHPRTELRHDNMRGEKQIVSVAAVSNAVQCKYAAAILADLARRRRQEDSGIAAGARPALGKETAVVLTDENLLLPLLYALPADIGRVNVTMGFPLRQSLAYTVRRASGGVAEPPPPQGRRLHVLPCRRRRHPRTPLCGRVRRRTHAHDARGDRP